MHFNSIREVDVVNPHSSSSLFDTGRRAGILVLLQLITALTVPFIMLHPIMVGSPAYLTEAAGHASQIRAAVLLSFLGSALTVYLGLTVFHALRVFSESAAIIFLIACTISAALDLMHAGTVMSMLSTSKAYVTSDGAAAGLYEVVGASVASARRSAHATQLLAIGVWMFTFYFSLLRYKLIPPVLAIIGLIGVALQFTGVTLSMFAGYKSIGTMAMPLLPIQITVAIWLIVKGFKVRNLATSHPTEFKPS